MEKDTLLSILNSDFEHMLSFPKEKIEKEGCGIYTVSLPLNCELKVISKSNYKVSINENCIVNFYFKDYLKIEVLLKKGSAKYNIDYKDIESLIYIEE